MLPEVTALNRIGSLVRLPPDQDVPITPRVRRILDSAPMRRLASISQLGMVALVYPGATHSRLEHSLGVYHNAIRFLARFANDDSFLSIVNDEAAEAFLLASLIHDVGHWPFCHPIEDMQLPGLAKHEERIGGWLADLELAQCIREDWSCDPAVIKTLLLDSPQEAGLKFLASCLSGPIDVDKLDYLQRDSLHAGVPYGRNFDAGRLVNSLCVHPTQSTLAVGEKGRTAAEMMVFARYVMFSEVYWHHTVRSATAMLQRAVYTLCDAMKLSETLAMTDAVWIERLRGAATDTNTGTSPDTKANTHDVSGIVDGLFGPHRQLYKRASEFNVLDGVDVHRKLARRPYWWLVACREQLAEQVSKRTGVTLRATDVLIDAPPVKLEVDINMDVVSRDGSVRSLEDVSPVASALARRQFDDQVKRVRVFVRGSVRESIRSRMPNMQEWTEEILIAANEVEDRIV